MKDTDVTDYDALINSDDISHEVKLYFIEKSTVYQRCDKIEI